MGTTVGVATNGGIVDALLELLELLPPEFVELLELALLMALELELFDAALEAELLDLLELLELLGRGVGVPQSWSRSGQGSVLLELWPQSRSPSLHELLLELDRRAVEKLGLVQLGRWAGFAPCPLQQFAASIVVTFGWTMDSATMSNRHATSAYSPILTNPLNLPLAFMFGFSDVHNDEVVHVNRSDWNRVFLLSRGRRYGPRAPEQSTHWRSQAGQMFLCSN